MINYNWQSEKWEDDADPGFEVDMTPEVSKDLELTFDTQEEFWLWYRGEKEN